MDITSVAIVSPQPLIGGPDPYITAVPRSFASPLLAGLVLPGRIAGSGTPTLSGSTVTIPAGSHYFVSDNAGGIVHVYFPAAVALSLVAASNFVYMYLSSGPNGTSYAVQLETAAAVPAGALSIGQNSGGTWADTAGIETTTGGKLYLNIEFEDLTLLATKVIYIPVAGKVTKLTAVVAVAVTTHDAVLTPSIGAVAITGGVVTCAAAGSALGQQNTATPSAANVVVPGNYIKVVETGSGGTPGAGACMLTIEITLT